jgi:hypothetical protein
MKFPRDNVKGILIAICGTKGLASSKRDGYAVSDRFTKLGFQPYVFIDNRKDGEWIKKSFKNTNPTKSIDVLNDLSLLSKLMNKFKGGTYDIVITVSAHGYSSGGSHFYFNGRSIGRSTMRPWYKGFEKSNCRVLTLLDTCHSENMTGFQKRGITDSRGNSLQQQQDGTFNPITFSGCRINQSLMEDISNEYGYGGGLTSAFLDTIEGKDKFDLVDVGKKCEARVKSLGAHMVFTVAGQASEEEDLVVIEPKRSINKGWLIFTVLVGVYIINVTYFTNSY